MMKKILTVAFIISVLMMFSNSFLPARYEPISFLGIVLLWIDMFCLIVYQFYLWLRPKNKSETPGVVPGVGTQVARGSYKLIEAIAILFGLIFFILATYYTIVYFTGGHGPWG